VLTKKYENKGLAHRVEFENISGNICKGNLKWTEKGVKFIKKGLKKIHNFKPNPFGK
jgi:hypothetical protein